MSTHKNLSRDPKPLVHGLKLKFAFQLMDVVFIVVGWLATCLHIETWGIHLWKRAVVLQGTCFVQIESYHWHSSMFIENETEHTKALDSWAGPWRQLQEMVAGTSSVSEAFVLVVWFCLMEELLHQSIGSLSHYLQYKVLYVVYIYIYTHPRPRRISFISN